MTRVAVFGAGGAVGEAVCHALLDMGREVVAAMRREHPDAIARLAVRGAKLVRANLEREEDVARALAGASAAVFTPILSVSARAAPTVAARGMTDVVFLSSNNVAVDPDQLTYAALLRGEAYARAALPQAVIVRPTLIYGDPRLPAVPQLMRLMRRFPVVPVPGAGKALQQPVHYRDLARFCAGVLGAAHGKTFALGGPEAVSQRDFYRRVSRAVGGARALFPAPRPVLRLLKRVAPLPLNAAQIARVDADKIAVPVDPIPADLQPRTTLDEGLAELARSLRPWRAPGGTA